ncbi:MAG: hypothetical protein LC731_01500 [Acidobacteria bacterium]|nr:hypothetical protein [Acidobacteriota bacterium]
MEARCAVEPPSIQFFLIFTAYAGWLMVFFILLFGAWSDLMFLVLIYLLLVAPVLMLGVAISLIPNYTQSSYHTGALVASGLYFSLFAMLIFMAMAAVVVRI